MAVKVDKDLCKRYFRLMPKEKVCLVWMKQLILAQQGLSAGNSLRILVH